MAAAYPLDASLTAWISRGFEVLADKVLADPSAVHFDVLVIGSGYGGAISAATMAGRTDAANNPIRVGVLERGKEYLPGAFPTGLRELPRHVRRGSHKEGLFDIRLGPEVNAVIANGVGGGSLINAGVMAQPLASVFAQNWPTNLKNLTTLPHFARAHELLGSRRLGVGNTIGKHPAGLPTKHLAIKAVAPQPTSSFFSETEITVAMTNTTSSGNVALKQCNLCGDCATGCNFGAKNSLDLNLLVRAHQNGAEIYSGATVLQLEKESGGTWLVHCVHTNAKLRARAETAPGSVTKIRARKVILAAGALGSPEILLRSKKAGLSVSGKLGHRCSTNGDMLVVDYATKADVNTVADETLKPSTRQIGPTITGMIDLRQTPDKVVIEEMSVPAGLRLAFTEIFATINTLHELPHSDFDFHGRGFPDDDIYAVSKQQIKRSALYAVMADDGAAGTIELVDEDTLDIHADGVARIRWQDDTTTTQKDALPDLEVFDDQIDTIARLTKDANTKGKILPNPVWKLLPSGLEWLLKDERGPLTTVHPLGGCAMADDASQGAVDDCGRVYSATAGTAVQAGLVVLDGSVIPTALGTNPALTISAVALRAADLLAAEWGYEVPPGNFTILDHTNSPTATPTWPVLSRLPFRLTDTAFTPPPTEVEVIERLVGPVTFKADGTTAKRIVELTLRFAPKDVTKLSRPPQDGGDPVLTVATNPSSPGTTSRIRIYDEQEWNDMERRWTPERRFEEDLEALALFSAPLTGTLKVLERQRSWYPGRLKRAIAGYWKNRGKRDVNQWQTEPDDGGPGWWSRVKSGAALASRSGEIRAFVYELKIGTPEPGGLALAGTSRRIEGYKRFTYEHRANPWRQLMEVEIDEFPGLKSSEGRTLKLDPRHLVRIGVPLFRIVSQNDGITALAGIGSFVGYFLRLLLGLHVWSFRAPDKENPVTTPERLPPTNLPWPATTHQYPLPLPDETPAGDTEVFALGQVVVTHFISPVPDNTKRPILMLHGYSASGTTFAHGAVPGNFAQHFSTQGWDVWVADLRTSSGQPDSAVQPWSFEQIGHTDIPEVFNHITAETGFAKINVIAHCMGTVVLSMAVLEGQPLATNNVRNQIERLALTQVGPLVVFSPANIFRGYVMRYFIDFLPEDYEFRPKEPDFADDLFDRILSTLPYPIEEFDIENPPVATERTPWTRTRHRMDALYGRDFNVEYMNKAMLARIDDHFGALSLRTVAQTLHFVRYSMITNYRGHNDFISRHALNTRWQFPTFSVHGANNGLSHVSTVDRMRQVLQDAGCIYVPPLVIPHAGHQDVLVGDNRAIALPAIQKFFTDPVTTVATPRVEMFVAYAPWTGPIITEQRPQTEALVLRLGTAPTHRTAEGVVMLRVTVSGDQLLRPDNPAASWNDEPYIVSHMALYKSSKLTSERWDAFEAPLPSLHPGHNGMNLGNALLVLVIYDDAPTLAPGPPPLATAAYWKGDPITQTVTRFSPTTPGGVPPVQPGGPIDPTTGLPPPPPIDPTTGLHPPPPIDYPYFRRAVVALRNALVTQRLITDANPQLPPGDRVGHSTLLRSTIRHLDKLPVGVVQNPTFTTAQLVFGVNDETGKPIIEALDQDRDIMDGVVPYDPPAAAPAVPDPAGTRFALLSCQYPAGFLDDSPAYASYGRLLARLDGPGATRPRFTVFAGDQVYVDPTAGLYDPSATDDRYARPYELWLRQRAVRGVLRRVPSFMLLDDHEIADNWEPLPPSSPDSGDNDEIKTAGLTAYLRYQRGMPPPLPPPAPPPYPLSFKFSFDGYPFFMLDTRTERTERRVGKPGVLFSHATGGTLSQLEQWLSAAPPGPKFIVTPSMLLPRHRRSAQHTSSAASLTDANLSALHSDGWDGFPRTLSAVLGFIALKQIKHVVFLSGDEHRGCVTNIELRDAAGATVLARAHSIHTTAAYAPFPFANSLTEDYLAKEVIDFAYDGVAYKCFVDATLPSSRDGAAVLRPYRDVASTTASAVWRLDYEYTDGGVKTLIL